MSDPATLGQPGTSPVRLAADRTLLLILGASLAIKLALVVIAERNAPILDEGAYLTLARNLAEQGRFEGTFRPPLYPAFEAIFLWSGLGTLGIRITQVLLSTVSVLLVYRLAYREAGARAARIASVLVAFNPILIAFSHRLWSETLFIFLLLLAIDLVARPIGAGRVARWIGAGALLGLAALTRPMLVTFLPFLGLWVLYRVHRERMGLAVGVARFAALAGAMMLVILPWSLRNVLTTGDFVLIDSNGAFNVLVGAQPEARFVDKDDVWSWRFGRVADQQYVDLVAREPGRAQSLAMQGALQHMRSDPAAFISKSWWEAGHLWTLDSFLLRHLRNRWYGPVPRWFVAIVTLVSAGWFATVVLAGFTGIAVTPSSPFRGILLLLLVQFTLLFAATYALSRYAVPLHALLAIPAGILLADPRGAIARYKAGLMPARRLVVLALVIVGLAMAWLRDAPLMGDMVLHSGSHYRFHMEEAPGIREVP